MDQQQAVVVTRPLVIACVLLFILRYNLVTRCIVQLYRDARHWLYGHRRVCVSCETGHAMEANLIDAEYWRREYGIRFESVIPDPFSSCACIDCIGYTRGHGLTPSWLSDYMQCLAEGRCNRLELLVWRRFTWFYPVTPWELRHTVRRRNYLPGWIVVLIELYNNAYLRCVITFFCLYAAALFSMHMWLPYVMLMNTTLAPVVPPPSTPLATEFSASPLTTRYSEALARLVYDCGKFVRSGEGFDPRHAFCIMQRREAWYPEAHSHVVDDDYNTIGKVQKQQQQASYFIDMDGLVYHVSGTVDATGRRVVPTLVQRRGLLEWLEHLRVHHSLACICPAFLGLIDDSVFLYDEVDARWIIMRDPRVTYNDTRHGQIDSTLIYNERVVHRNPLYDNYRACVGPSLPPAKLRHYARYEVSYWLDTVVVVPPPPPPPPQYRMYDQRLLEYDTVENCLSADDPLERTILLTMHATEENHTNRRVKRVLENEQAICFNFCHAINKRVTE